MKIYLGEWPLDQTRDELVLQVAWTFALLVFCEIAWRVVRRRLSVLGG
jgi:ABC-type uncharacterized transport system permease subunit